jgi:hypothetical protein
MQTGQYFLGNKKLVFLSQIFYECSPIKPLTQAPKTDWHIIQG